MFEIVIDYDININGRIECIKDKIKSHGQISVKELMGILSPTTKNLENWDKDGWGYELIDSGFISEECLDRPGSIVIKIPDPKKLSLPVEFDVVSHPSHYTEGRTYEPRKVIADWGLNFNLGNAVKYLSKAGRKGDKIEDLRKAIQYIQFEIEELGGV